MQQKVISNSFNVNVVYDGENGKDGKGVVNVNIYYLASASQPPTPSGAPPQTGWADDGNSLIIAANADKHLYESSCSTYTDGSYSWTRPVDDGLIRDMASAQEQFALSSSGTAQPTSGWATSVTPQKGKWIWSRTVLTFKDGSTKVVGVQCVGYCGDDGNGIVSITNTFALSAQGTTASETTAPVITGNWSTAQPKPTAEHPYLWRKEVTVYTDTSKNTTKYFLVAARGGDGNHGHTGRLYYFAGTYDGTPRHYKIEATQAPYVKVGGEFYMLDLGGVEPGTIPYAATEAPSDSSTEWTKMQSAFAYYIAQAFFGENAYLGSFIINGDWMISQYGVLVDSSGTKTIVNADNVGTLYNGQVPYAWFEPSDPTANTAPSSGYKFAPNFAVDGKTGKSYQNDAYVKGTINATSGVISGNVDIGTTGNKMQIYADETVGFYKRSGIKGVSGGTEILDLGFRDSNYPTLMLKAPTWTGSPQTTLYPGFARFYHGNRFTIEIGSRQDGKIHIYASPSAWPSRDEVTMGEVFVGDDEILRVRLS